MSIDSEGETIQDAPGFRRVRESSFVGRRLGEFVIDGVIAQGGMGMVFRGKRAVSNAPVAIKVLLAGPRAKETHRQRFEREAEVIAALRHPHIVQVLSVGIERGHPWIALELVEGGTLEGVFREGLPPNALVDLLLPVARAIGFAHRKGVIHRDLKPSNILIRDGDRAPVVTDFGLARDLTQQSDLTRSGITLGTPVYMAPEQAMGRRASAATDVYGLGAILYEGLTGRPPFDDGDGVFALFAAIESSKPTAPSKLAEVSSGLERIVLRALEKQPEDRYPDADALADALEGWRAGDDRPGGMGVAVAGLSVAVVVLLVTLAAVLFRAESPVPEPTPTATAEQARAIPQPTPTAATGHHTLVIQPGPVHGVDATVRNDGLYFNDNAGNSAALIIGDRAAQRGDFRAFLRLDHLRLPEGARVERARLVLRIATNALKRPVTAAARIVVPTRNLHGRGQAQTPWVEGAGGCDRYLDGIAWEGDRTGPFPRAASRQPRFTQPNVVPGRPLASVGLGPSRTGTVTLEITEAIQAWQAKPAENHGLRLDHGREGSPWDDGRISFCSSDHPKPARRPRWEIEYVGLPPLPAPDPSLAAARARAAEQLKIATASTGSSAIAAAQRACELAPFWGEPYYHRARLLLLRYGDDSIWPGFNLAERAPQPFKEAELYVARAKELIRLGYTAQAMADIERARKAGATSEAAELLRRLSRSPR